MKKKKVRHSLNVNKRPWSRWNGLLVVVELFFFQALLLSQKSLVNASKSAKAFPSRAYPLGCSQEDSSYYDYDNCPFPPPGLPVKSTQDYYLVQRLGTGKFSDVFSAVEADREKGASETENIDTRSLVVVKVRRLAVFLVTIYCFILPAAY